MSAHFFTYCALVLVTIFKGAVESAKVDAVFKDVVFKAENLVVRTDLTAHRQGEKRILDKVKDFFISKILYDNTEGRQHIFCFGLLGQKLLSVHKVLYAVSFKDIFDDRRIGFTANKHFKVLESFALLHLFHDVKGNVKHLVVAVEGLFQFEGVAYVHNLFVFEHFVGKKIFAD